MQQPTIRQSVGHSSSSKLRFARYMTWSYPVWVTSIYLSTQAPLAIYPFTTICHCCTLWTIYALCVTGAVVAAIHLSVYCPPIDGRLAVNWPSLGMHIRPEILLNAISQVNLNKVLLGKWSPITGHSIRHSRLCSFNFLFDSVHDRLSGAGEVKRSPLSVDWLRRKYLFSGRRYIAQTDKLLDKLWVWPIIQSTKVNVYSQSNPSSLFGDYERRQERRRDNEEIERNEHSIAPSSLTTALCAFHLLLFKVPSEWIVCRFTIVVVRPVNIDIVLGLAPQLATQHDHRPESIPSI